MASAPIEESQSHGADDEDASRQASRRELVRLTLRETMHQHGIPSDWIECRSLPAGAHQQSCMHVQFLVRKADQQLLAYVHPFQEAFWQQILQLDPRGRDWLLSVGWEFYGQSIPMRMPDRSSWPGTGGDTQPPDQSEEELASDLEALQALMSKTDVADLPVAEPRAGRADT